MERTKLPRAAPTATETTMMTAVRTALFFDFSIWGVGRGALAGVADAGPRKVFDEGVRRCGTLELDSERIIEPGVGGGGGGGASWVAIAPGSATGCGAVWGGCAGCGGGAAACGCTGCIAGASGGRKD